MTAGRRAVGALAVALFAWWATVEGGYAPGAWYPGALLVLAAVVALVRPRMVGALPREARWALAALAAFTLWSFCSIAWADARGLAWDGANRTLLYLTLFALFALLPWTAREAAAGIAAFALATAAVGLAAIARALAGDDATVFVDGRLAAPIGYENATAALFLAAFWAALLLAARPSSAAPAPLGTRRPEADRASRLAAPGAVRGLLLATAGVLLELTILAQSRGSLIAGLVTVVLALVLVRDRRPLLLALGAVGVATAAALPALLAPYEAAATDGSPELVPVALALGGSAALLFVAGAGLDAIGRWIGQRRRAVAAAGGVAALAAVVVVVAAGPMAAPGGAADSRFTAGAGSGRYDFWRVAMLEFARHPLTGVGADNFAHDYARDRRHGEEPLFPHSLALRALAQTGIVGAALLALFLLAVAAAVRRAPTAAALAAFVAAATWVVHGSIDWLWEMPAVAAPAMAGLGLAANVNHVARSKAVVDETRPGGGVSSTTPSSGARWLTLSAAAIAAVAALSYTMPALAAREVERAVRTWDEDPAGAQRSLERARELNPLSDRADLVAGALARDPQRARRAYLAALERDGRNWHAHVAVALIDLRAGRRAPAIERLARAGALNPREGLITAATQTARTGSAPAPELVERLDEHAIPGPIEPRPVTCTPVLGLAAECTRERDR